MGNMKRAMALILALVMSLCLVVSASAATSPTTAPTTAPTAAPTTAPANAGFDAATGTDSNVQDYNNVGWAISKVENGTATVTTAGAVGETSITLSIARDADNNQVAITAIGDGTKGVFDTKEGQAATTVTVSSTAAVTIANNAFSKSQVKTLNLDSANVRIKKDAFKWTKAKNLVIKINGATKASQIAVGKGSFNGLSKKAKIIVSKKMSAKEFKKLKKKLKAKGFKGTIVRK